MNYLNILFRYFIIYFSELHKYILVCKIYNIKYRKRKKLEIPNL